ncbi:unnamed protein product [Arctogadus glacialis]
MGVPERHLDPILEQMWSKNADSGRARAPTCTPPHVHAPLHPSMRRREQLVFNCHGLYHRTAPQCSDAPPGRDLSSGPLSPNRSPEEQSPPTESAPTSGVHPPPSVKTMRRSEPGKPAGNTPREHSPGTLLGNAGNAGNAGNTPPV